MASRTGLALGRIAPQDVLQEGDVGVADRVAALQPGVRAQHADRLRPAAVGRHDVAAGELAPEIGDGAQHVARHRHRGDLGARGRRGRRATSVVRAGGRLRLQQLQEAEVLADVVDHEAEQEAVVQGEQLVVLGQLVGRRRRA